VLAQPVENEVRVAVKAVGLNFADVFAILSLYGATPKGSFIPGLEYAGVVRGCLHRQRKSGTLGAEH
jgi:alcohol dehydrogenase